MFRHFKRIVARSAGKIAIGFPLLGGFFDQAPDKLHVVKFGGPPFLGHQFSGLASASLVENRVL